MNKRLLTILFSLVPGSTAFAGGAVAQEPVSVPEAGVTGSIAALAAVAVVGAVAWERRRKKTSATGK